MLSKGQTQLLELRFAKKGFTLACLLGNNSNAGLYWVDHWHSSSSWAPTYWLFHMLAWAENTRKYPSKAWNASKAVFPGHPKIQTSEMYCLSFCKFIFDLAFGETYVWVWVKVNIWLSRSHSTSYAPTTCNWNETSMIRSWGPNCWNACVCARATIRDHSAYAYGFADTWRGLLGCIAAYNHGHTN